ncbi:hypothetical protein QTP70_017230, partial [Hemibagrus guttatus]
ECPECGTSFSGRRLEEAPISIPNPFTNGHKTPCAFLIAPAEDNTLREYDGRSDLHTGITDTNGVVYNYTKSGVRRDREGWEHCISIMLVQPDMYNLINQWDQYLEKFSSAQMWDPLWQSFNEENHNCYSYTLMFINCVLAMQSKRALSKDEFTQTFILPPGKMGKSKDLSEFDQGQIVMARRPEQSISKTAALVGCSRAAVVSFYQKHPLST